MARTAIIVFHGIGQHQEFDTLEGVAHALLKREGGDGGVTVRLVETGETPVAAASVCATERTNVRGEAVALAKGWVRGDDDDEANWRHDVASQSA